MPERTIDFVVRDPVVIITLIITLNLLIDKHKERVRKNVSLTTKTTAVEILLESPKIPEICNLSSSHRIFSPI